ncbi:nectin-1-like [Zonotrichia leucophrys gambelii]|uniref:nectin-1-like n=1 Tax=Zonotrichia leucophrys gambelii TaxID=257770 RepID=UPI0031403A7E
MFQGTMAFPKPMAFPPAWIWGFALFLALKEPIQSDIIIVAALGGEANFHCNFLPSMDVLQATWQKRNGASFHNMATYSQIHGLRLIRSFQKKVSFTRATPKASAIILQNLTLEDDSYYRCIFNVFCHGSLSKDIHLNIQSKFSTNTFSLSGIQFGSDVLRRYITTLSTTQRFSMQQQKTHGTPRTPGKTGLQQDLGERASLSLYTSKDQHIPYPKEQRSGKTA